MKVCVKTPCARSRLQHGIVNVGISQSGEAGFANARLPCLVGKLLLPCSEVAAAFLRPAGSTVVAAHSAAKAVIRKVIGPVSGHFLIACRALPDTCGEKRARRSIVAVAENRH